MKTSTKLLAVILLLALGLTLTACGNDEAAASTELVINDGDFSEMQLIHYMVKLLVEDHTDLTVTIKDQMSSVNLFRELTGNQSADLFNSYDGTLLTTFLKLDPEDVPEGMTLYDFANQEALKKHNIRPVSYTHLDVYKRQPCRNRGSRPTHGGPLLSFIMPPIRI